MPRGGGRRRRRRVIDSSDEDSGDDTFQMQAQQDDDRKNKDILKGILATVIETQKVGIATLAKLDEQNEQILRIDGYLDEMNQDLKKSQRSIENIKSLSSYIVNKFRKLDDGKGNKSGGWWCCGGSSEPEPAVTRSQRPEPRPAGNNGPRIGTGAADEAPVDVPDEIFDVPSAVLIGDDLELTTSKGDGRERTESAKEVMKRLLKLACTPSEEVLCLYSATKGNLEKKVFNCVAMTGTRLLWIQEGKLYACFLRFDLFTGVKDEGNFLVIELVSEDEYKVEIPDASVRDFFVKSCYRAMMLAKRDVQEENALLDQIGSELDVVLQIAKDQNKAIRQQNDQLDKLKKKVHSTDNAIKGQTKQMKKILGK